MKVQPISYRVLLKYNLIFHRKRTSFSWLLSSLTRDTQIEKLSWQSEAISEADNVIDDRGGCGGHSPNNLRRPTQFSLSLSLLWFLLHYVMLLLVSVTSLGENSRLWQNFKSIWPLLSRLFSIRQNIDLTLAICKLLGRFSLL